jgi:hypothetical protein
VFEWSMIRKSQMTVSVAQNTLLFGIGLLPE